MNEEAKSDPWMSWCAKGFILLILTVLPVMGILSLLLFVTWIPPDWIGGTLLVSGLVFLIGAAILMTSKNIRLWGYSLLAGFLFCAGCMVAATLQLLLLIPVPVFGNALYAVVILVTGTIFTLGLFWPVKEPPRFGSVGSTGLVTTASKIMGQKQGFEIGLFDRQEETILAIGLIEIPHEYVYAEDERAILRDIIEQSQSIARSLSSVAFGWNIQRSSGTTRVVYFTFSKEERKSEYDRKRLDDALQHNLRGFGFESIGTYSGPELKQSEVGSAAIITGVPLSFKDESQKQDPLETMAGVLQSLENGMFQVFIEPFKMSDSQLRSLERNYRREVERSETTISKESSGWLGKHQESRTIVNSRAKKQAEILERQIKRLSNPNLHKVTLTVLSWGQEIEQVEQDTQRLVSGLVGGLRPDNDEDEYRVQYRRKRKDIVRLMRGLPVGPSSILTSDEVAGYLVPPRRDITIRVTKREKFSSGTRASLVDAPRQVVQVERITSDAPINVSWLIQTPEIHLGNPIDESGNILPNRYVTFGTDQTRMHLGVFGNTQSGKTTSVISIIGQAIALGVNPVVLVPSKSYEWWVLMLMFPHLRIFTCGRSDIAKLVMNIWNPPKNVRLSKWVDRLVEVWTLWFPNDQVISMHIEDVIYTVYRNCGWDLRTNEKGKAILLDDVVDAAREVSEKLDYGDEVKSNLYGALVARIKSVLRKPALVDLLNTPTGLTITELLAYPTIIDMDGLSKNDKTLLMGILTAGIIEYKLANPTEKITDLLVLEEAHYLLSRVDSAGEANSGARMQAVNAFVEMLRVVGGTGLGVILIDQSPTSLVPEAVKLPVNLIIHALPDDDQRLVGKHARCTDAQAEHIGGMPTGEAVVYLQHEGEPKNVRMLPVSAFVKGDVLTQSVDSTMVREHMQRVFKENAHLKDSRNLPEDIEERLKIKKKPDDTTPEPTQESAKYERWLQSFAEYRPAIERIVKTSMFEDYCYKCIAEDDPGAFLKLLQAVSRKHGASTFQSDLFVLAVTMEYYGADENDRFFERIGKIMNGEQAA
jgi:hypothetical protein